MPSKKFNQSYIRVGTMSKLLAGNYAKTGEHIEGSSAIGCQRWERKHSDAPGLAQVAVSLENGHSKARMHKHFVCNNYKLCDLCARRQSAHMRDWITKALIPAAQAQGYALALLTLTASHKRDCDWKTDNADKFYAALRLFSRRMAKAYKAIGCIGQLRSGESPVGANGLHLHIHDELLYKPGADLAAFAARALAAWKDACKEVGLRCTARGVDVTTDFDPHYVAKDEKKATTEAKGTAFELAAHDTKRDGKNKTMFELLDSAAKGDEQAGNDWLRAARAVAGRSRWNAGQLPKKLGIATPSDWENPDHIGEALAESPQPALVVQYPIEQHLVATAPDHRRPGLALILRAARQELKRPGTTRRMVSALCADYVSHRVGVIARAAARQFDEASADRINNASRLAVEAFKARIDARLNSPVLVYDLVFS